MGLDIADAAWIAGFLDGEGYFSIYSRSSAGQGKPDIRPRALVRVNQASDRRALDRLQRLLEGSIHEAARPTSAGNRVWGWQWQSARSMREHLPAIASYMTVKREQAELVLAFVQTIRTRGLDARRLTEIEHTERRNIAEALLQIRGGQ